MKNNSNNNKPTRKQAVVIALSLIIGGSIIYTISPSFNYDQAIHWMTTSIKQLSNNFFSNDDSSQISLAADEYQLELSNGAAINTNIIDVNSINYHQFDIQGKPWNINIGPAASDGDAIYLILECDMGLYESTYVLLLKINSNSSVEWFKKMSFASNLDSLNYSPPSIVVLEDGSIAVSLANNIYNIDSNDGTMISDFKTEEVIDKLFYNNGVLTAHTVSQDDGESKFESMLAVVDLQNSQLKPITQFSFASDFNDMYSLDPQHFIVLSSGQELQLIDATGTVIYQSSLPDDNYYERIIPSKTEPDHFLVVSKQMIREFTIDGEELWNLPVDNVKQLIPTASTYILITDDFVGTVNDVGSVKRIDDVSLNPSFWTSSSIVYQQNLGFATFNPEQSIINSDLSVKLDAGNYIIIFKQI